MNLTREQRRARNLAHLERELTQQGQPSTIVDPRALSEVARLLHLPGELRPRVDPGDPELSVSQGADNRQPR